MVLVLVHLVVLVDLVVVVFIVLLEMVVLELQDKEMQVAAAPVLEQVPHMVLAAEVVPVAQEKQVIQMLVVMEELDFNFLQHLEIQ